MGERKKERKKEKEREGEEHRQARERWSVVLPEEEAWMTQASGFCNQKDGERQKHRASETERVGAGERERQTCRRQRRAGTHPLL